MRVMTLNIWNYNEPWPRRRDLIVQAIRAADADVVALQEIRSDPRRDERGPNGELLNQAQQLAIRLPEYPHLVYQPAMYYRDHVWEGLAILSRRSIDRSGWALLTQDLTDPDDRHQRIVLYARFDLAHGPFYLFNTHLSLSRTARQRTLAQVIEYMTQRSGFRLLVGDLNELPDGPPLAQLREAGWVDVWTELRPEEPGYTFRSDEPWQRIDYVWASPELRPHLQDIVLVGRMPDADGVYPSDHLGLVVSLDLAD